MLARVYGLFLIVALLATSIGCSSSHHGKGIPVKEVDRRPATPTFNVPTPGMEPTLHCRHSVAEPSCRGVLDDLIVVKRSEAIKRGSVIVFHAPPAANTRCSSGTGDLFVKRVVGMPGDLLREGNGWIYVNGKRLEEAYIGADARKADANDSFTGPARVPTKSYFAIGDNRSESCDSRTWGSVPASNIVGVVTQIIRQRS